MGKSRRNRGGAAQRRPPVAKQIKPPSDPALARLREEKILPIIKILQDSDASLRLSAAAALSELVADDSCRRLLLREQVVHIILSQVLEDTSLGSRAVGWKVLQLLAEHEAADFCVHLHRQDVLKKMADTVYPLSKTLDPHASALGSMPKSDQEFIASIAISLASLTTSLAAAGNEMLEAISADSTFVQFLIALLCLDKKVAVGDLAQTRRAVLTCLVYLCEDNPLLVEQFVKSPDNRAFQTLLALKDEASNDGILACATLHTIFASLHEAGEAPATHDADDAVLITPLTAAVRSILPSHAATNGVSNDDIIERQQFALETLASIATSITAKMREPVQSTKPRSTAKHDEAMDDVDSIPSEEKIENADGDNDEEIDGDEDLGMDENEMEADMEMVTGVDSPSSDDLGDLPVLAELLQTALPELLRVACLPPSSDQVREKMRGLALSALRNTAWTVSLIDFSDHLNSNVRNTWLPLGQGLWQQIISLTLTSDTADLQLATQVTSLAWALARSLGSTTPLQAGEHRKFIALYQATRDLASPDPDDPFQSLGVQCIGVLGQLALHPAPADRNRDIGSFLVSLLAELPSTPAADAVEALNQLFDVYADEAYPYDKEVFWQSDFHARLEAAVPRVRALLKTIDKKKQAELRARADEALLNLTRFLAYKKKHA